MTKIKLKWKVVPVETGRMGWFQKRGWPTAHYHGTELIAAHIKCEDEYLPHNVKTGNHKELTVEIVEWHVPRDPKKAAWDWYRLKKKFKTLTEAKEGALLAIQSRPDFWPKEIRDANSTGKTGVPEAST